MVLLEGPFVEGNTALEQLSSILRQTLISGEGWSQILDSGVQLADDKASDLITWASLRSLGDNREVTIDLECLEVKQRTNGIGLPDIVIDISGVTNDLTSVELRQDLLHVPVHIADRGDRGLTSALYLPRSIAEHRTVRIGRSLIIRTIIIGSYPCVIATAPMSWEEGSIVVDREGTKLLSSPIV